jgi:chorismate mutase
MVADMRRDVARSAAICKQYGLAFAAGSPEKPTGQGGSMTDDRLTRYRESIDNIDAALVFMLAERFKITQAVGEYKAQTGLPPADPGREDRQITRLRALAQQANLDPDFTEKFLRFIIDEVIRHHQGMQAG